MGFNRTDVSADGKLRQPLRAGDGFIANPLPKIYAAETDEDITLAELSGGYIVQGSTLTSDVAYTLPTAAAILAEWPEMDVGDSFVFYVGNHQAGAFDVLISANTGISTSTTVDNNVAPKGGKMFLLVKASATTMNLY